MVRVEWNRGWVLAVAMAAVMAVAIAGCGGDSSTSDSSTSAGEPKLVSLSELSESAAESPDGVYWLGPREGATYELSETDSGRIYVRYLRGGAEAGDERPDFITVGTYPAPAGGVAELRKAASKQRGARLHRTEDGALLLIDPSSPQNAHLAYPGVDAQIEVYSPVPGQALRLASKGTVRPVP